MSNLYNDNFSHLTGDFRPEPETMRRHLHPEWFTAYHGNTTGTVEYGTANAAFDCFHGRSERRVPVWRITFEIDGHTHRGTGLTRDEAYQNAVRRIEDFDDGVPF